MLSVNAPYWFKQYLLSEGDDLSVGENNLIKRTTKLTEEGVENTAEEFSVNYTYNEENLPTKGSGVYSDGEEWTVEYTYEEVE